MNNSLFVMGGKLGGTTYIDIFFIGSIFLDFLMTLATIALLRPVLEAIFLVDRPEELRTRILSF